MAIQTRYLFTAAMDVEAAQEKLFNEVYDTEHVPLLLKVPGVIATQFGAQDIAIPGHAAQRHTEQQLRKPAAIIG